jgi:DNA-3-methyladenine glycosylase
MQRLGRKFYTRETLTVAKELLGKLMVRVQDNKKMVGRIVETEAYIGPEDKASHASGGKITERNKIEYDKGGLVYIYLCYGMYWQFNVVTSKKEKPECVLIRALEPVEGINPEGNTEKKRLNFLRKNCAGPGRLCRWMNLDKSFNGEDLVTSKRIWIEKGIEIKKKQIAASKRIGIDYAGGWAKKPWRFYIKDNPFVSV